MKKFLHLLALFCLCVVTAQATTYQWEAKTNFATSKSALESDGWTITTSNGTYTGYDGTKGMQFGSGNQPEKTLILSSTTSSKFSGNKITKVTINTSGASSVSANLSVSVGGTSYGSKSISATATNYDFTGNASGNVEIKYSQSSSKAIYLKSIDITYEEVSTVNAPKKITFDPAAGSIDTNTRVTITADGTNPNIEYDIDGTNYKAYSGSITLPAGTHAINAKASNSAGSTTASATYIVTQAAPSTTSSVTFDFTKSDYGLPNDGNSYVKNVTTIKEGIVSNELSGGEAWRYWKADPGLRAYTTSNKVPTFTFSVPEGNYITKIEWTGANTDFKLDGANSNLGMDNGWSGKAQSVKLIYTGTSGKTIQTVMVTYELNGEGTEPPQKNVFAFDENIPAQMTVGDTYTLVLGDKIPDSFEIIVDYDEIATVSEEAPYIITAVAPGTATFTALWDEDDVYKSGEKEFTIEIKEKETVATPTFSPEAGEVEEGKEVTISTATEEATIYYTLNEATPTTSSTRYDKPIIINEAVTIKAIAVKDGMNDSEIATASYTVKTSTPGEDLGYKLITSLDELDDEAEIIIVNTETKLAIGTTQNTNNRSAGEVTFGAGNLTADPGDDVAIIKAKKVSDGNYTLYVTNGDSKGYLYAASSSKNYLNTRPSNSDNNSVASITFNNGTTIKFIGSNTNSTIQYNPNNGSPIFSCYGSASLKPVVIYKKTAVETQPDPVLGELTYTVTGGKTIEDDTIIVDFGDEFTFSAENATNIEVKVDDEPANGKFENGNYTWTIDKYYDAAYVEVTATLGEDSKTLDFLLDVNCPNPERPTLSINGELISGESMTVPSGTEVILDCENAVSWTGMVGDVDLEGKPIPYKFIVSEETEIIAAGLNAKEEEGETLEFTFYVGELDLDAPKVGSNYRQLFDDSELQLTEAYYVIGRHYLKSDPPVNVAMGRTFTNGNFNSSTNVIFTDNIPTIRNGNDLKDGEFTVMTVTGEDVLIVKLEKQGEQWGMKTVNMGDGFTSSQKYLSLGEGTAFKLCDEFTPVNIKFTTQKNAKISFGETSERLITYNNNGTFNNYKTESTNVQLYRYTEKNIYAPEFEPIVLAEGKTTEQPLSPKYVVENAPSISYRVKGNTTIVSIEEDNKVKAQERSGNAVIIASWLDDDANKWFAGRVEIPVTVKKVLITEPNENGEFYFRHSEVRGKKDVGVVAQAVYYAGEGTVTYSISREGLEDASKEIAINPETGMIRPDDLIAPLYSQLIVTDEEGKEICGRENPYTITATVNETSDHLEASASYIIYIEEGEQPEIVAGDVTFDFANKGYDMFLFDSTTGGANAPYERNANEVTGQEDHVPVFEFSEGAVNIKMNEDSNYRWFKDTKGATEFRMNTGAKMTIYSPKGTIKSVKFTLSDGSGNKLAYVDANNKENYFSGSSINWTSSSDNGDVTVKFTVSGTVKIKSIEVNSLITSTGSDDLKDLELGFNDSDRIVNIFAEEETTLPNLLYNEDVIAFESIEFDIDEINEMDENKKFTNYDIIRDNEAKTIKVKVNVPGVYTFRAFYHGNEYLNGAAILRLNVFPHLSVLPADEDQLSNDTRTEAPELTLVHPDPETGTTKITLPSLSELENQYKYSTIHISKVIVKDGDKITIYKDGDDKSDPESVIRKANAENDPNDPNDPDFPLSKLPKEVEFLNDGYVEYFLTYANTGDFTANTKVHVIQMPDWTFTGKDGEVRPLNNSKLQYCYFKTDYYPTSSPVGEAPNPNTNTQNSRAKAPQLSDWKIAELDENGNYVFEEEGDKFTKEGGSWIGVTFRTVKDVNEVTDNALSIDDPVLSTEYQTLVFSGGIATSIDNIEIDNNSGDGDYDAEAEYYNLQGIKVDRPEKGIYIVVKGDKVTKVIF